MESNAAKGGIIIWTLTLEKRSGRRTKIGPYSECTPNSVIDGVKSLKLYLAALITLLKIVSTQNLKSMLKKE